MWRLTSRAWWLCLPTPYPRIPASGSGPCACGMLSHAQLLPGHTSSYPFILSTLPGSHHPQKKPGGKRKLPRATSHSLLPRRKQSRGHPALLSLPVAVDLIKDLFNKRGSEAQEACHASPLSDKALCDSLNLLPVSRTKPSCHRDPAVHRHGRFGAATAVPQLSGCFCPTNGMQSCRAAGTTLRPQGSLQGVTLQGDTGAKQSREFPPQSTHPPSPLGTPTAKEGPGWRISP